MFWLLTEKTSEISYVIVPCSNQKTLLTESGRTDLPENINTVVYHSFLLYFWKVLADH